jgi:hypothetical protein
LFIRPGFVLHPNTTVVPNGFALISAMASRALATGNQWFTDLTDEGLFYLQL